jgi:hypothetical protein
MMGQPQMEEFPSQEGLNPDGVKMWIDQQVVLHPNG